MKTIEERIYNIIEGVAQWPIRQDETLSLSATSGMDSLDAVEAVMKIEDEFNIDMSDSALNILSMSAHDVVCMIEYEYLKLPKEKEKK